MVMAGKRVPHYAGTGEERPVKRYRPPHQWYDGLLFPPEQFFDKPNL